MTAPSSNSAKDIVIAAIGAVLIVLAVFLWKSTAPSAPPACSPCDMAVTR